MSYDSRARTLDSEWRIPRQKTRKRYRHVTFRPRWTCVIFLYGRAAVDRRVVIIIIIISCVRRSSRPFHRNDIYRRYVATRTSVITRERKRTIARDPDTQRPVYSSRQTHSRILFPFLMIGGVMYVRVPYARVNYVSETHNNNIMDVGRRRSRSRRDTYVHDTLVHERRGNGMVRRAIGIVWFPWPASARAHVDLDGFRQAPEKRLVIPRQRSRSLRLETSRRDARACDTRRGYR